MAAAVSIELILACAYGERRNAMWVAPSTATLSVN